MKMKGTLLLTTLTMLITGSINAQNSSIYINAVPFQNNRPSKIAKEHNPQITETNISAFTLGYSYQQSQDIQYYTEFRKMKSSSETVTINPSHSALQGLFDLFSLAHGGSISSTQKETSYEYTTDSKSFSILSGSRVRINETKRGTQHIDLGIGIRLYQREVLKETVTDGQLTAKENYSEQQTLLTGDLCFVDERQLTNQLAFISKLGISNTPFQFGFKIKL